MKSDAFTKLSGAVYQSTDMNAGFIIPRAKWNSDRNPSYARFFFSIAVGQIDRLKAFKEQYLIVICEGMGFMRFNLQDFLPWLSYVSPFMKKGTDEPLHWDPEFHFYPDGRIILQLGKGKSVDVRNSFTPWKAS